MGEKIMKILGVSEDIRGIDPFAVEKLATLLRENNPQIFMRHGEQQKTEQIQRLPTIEQKIEMMRLPNNMENSLTRASLAEWMEGIIVWEYLKEKTGRCFRLESSKNRRSEFPAATLALALKITVHTNDDLNCVNYPSCNKMSNEEILNWLPDGTLPWEKQKVDAIIGPNIFQHITQGMERFLNSSKDPHVIVI